MESIMETAFFVEFPTEAKFLYITDKLIKYLYDMNKSNDFDEEELLQEIEKEWEIMEPKLRELMEEAQDGDWLDEAETELEDHGENLIHWLKYHRSEVAFIKFCKGDKSLKNESPGEAEVPEEKNILLANYSLKLNDLRIQEWEWHEKRDADWMPMVCTVLMRMCRLKGKEMQGLVTEGLGKLERRLEPSDYKWRLNMPNELAD